MELTDRQRFCLEWLRQNPQSQAGWRRNGKAAYGPPDKWDAMEIKGKQGSIVIATADWEALRGHLKAAPYESKQIWIPALTTSDGDK